MSRWLFLLTLAGLVTLGGGCATTSKEPQQDEVSSIPWNRPQQWEGQGGFGGFRPPGNRGY